MEAFAALADPTRRRIVELLADGEQDAGELGAHFRLSQPAISRHLRILRESGLVRVRPHAQLRRWLAEARTFEAAVGGAVAIDFGEGGIVAGEVRELERPRLLEYSWTF